METITFRIKEKIEKGGRAFVVLEMYKNDTLPAMSVQNLMAIDKKGNIIWVAERPTTGHDMYQDIYFRGNKLLSLSAGGQLHEIDEETGKIVSSRMIK